jgi:hypothetical protein
MGKRRRGRYFLWKPRKRFRESVILFFLLKILISCFLRYGNGSRGSNLVIVFKKSNLEIN